ncbi:MAG: glycosyltransferase [Gemmatimonadetes bacterium]|nr:MAG: glycosyltransferase [Gemmatimonadota bacterium]
MTILMLVKEKFPTIRPMLIELWNHEIQNRDHKLIWIMQTEQPAWKIRIHNWNGSRVYLLPAFPSKNSITQMANLAVTLIGKGFFATYLMLRERIDHVHVHDGVEEGIIALFLKRIFGQPYTYGYTFPMHRHVQQPPDSTGWRHYLKLIYNRFRGWGYRVVLQQAARVFPISKALGDLLEQELNIPTHRLLPVGECASETFLTVGRNHDYKPHREQVSLIYVGSLGPWRNIPFIIDCFDHLWLEHPHVQLYLLGWGEYPTDIPALQRYIYQKRSAESIHFVGKVPYETVPEIVTTCDIGLSPIPPSELFRVATPTKCIEYLALKLPVVANREIEEQKKILEASQGGILTAYNRTEFTEALCLLVEDEHRRITCAQKGFEWIQTHRTFKQMAVTIDQTLTQLKTGSS